MLPSIWRIALRHKYIGTDRSVHYIFVIPSDVDFVLILVLKLEHDPNFLLLNSFTYLLTYLLTTFSQLSEGEGRKGNINKKID